MIKKFGLALLVVLIILTAFPLVTQATDTTCQMTVIGGQKTYQGCDIDYSQFSAKSATDINLKAKLTALPKERQAELNYQLKQTQAAVLAKGGTWIANWNIKFILNDEEKKHLTGLLGQSPKLPISISKSLTMVDLSLPDFYDWRNVGGKNYITSVKDQGGCGSCWAFGADASFEGHIQAYYNNPNLVPDLAEQDLVSCALPYPSDGVGGCQGAYDYQIENIFKTYWANTGNATETSFPYSATDASCSAKAPTWQATAWKDLSYKKIALTDNVLDNINKIKSALIANGPVNVGMTVYRDLFGYQSGIYQHTTDSVAGGHSVTIVGFGKDDGQDYWIVKNSWASTWGENGYFEIYADDSNISSWFAFVVDRPKPPTPQSTICADNDRDSYCYWGLGSKPTSTSTCPSSCLAHNEKDCDDSNSIIYQGCGKSTEKIGTLNVISSPTGANVYVENLVSGNWVYRGKTPLTTNLNVGNRKIKVSKFGYLDVISTVNIQEGLTANLNVNSVHDPQFEAGWPVMIGGSSATEAIQYFPKVDDLNGDGNKEILIVGSEHSWLYDPNGNLLPGWPQQGLGEFTSGGFIGAPSIGDLNGDGKKEIVIGGAHDIKVFDYSGSAHTFNVGGGVDTVVLSNVVGNNTLQLVFGYNRTSNYLLTVMNYSNGVFSTLPGWPVILDGYVTNKTSPAVGDVDNDGNEEIVVKIRNDSGTYIDILSKTGKVKKSIKILSNGSLNGSSIHVDSDSGPVLVDINGDGKLEIGFTYRVFDRNGVIDYVEHLDFIDLNGSDMPGWPYLYEKGNFYNNWESPVVGDLDNNSFPEIVTWRYSAHGNNTEMISILNSNGKTLEGWPKYIAGDTSFTAGIIGDINGDGYPDLIMPVGADWKNGNMPRKILFLDRFGHEIYNSIILPGATFWETIGVAMADVNSDGKTELVVVSTDFNNKGFIGVYSLNAPYNPSNIPWPTYKHDNYNTGRYGGESSTAKCVDYDYSNQLATNTPPLPLVKGYTYDTISNPTFNPSVIPNPQNETYGDYCTMNGIKTASSSGVGSGLMERYCTNNRRSSHYYLYDSVATSTRLQTVCPNGCSNGACVSSNPIPTVQNITLANCAGPGCSWLAGTTKNVTWQYSNFNLASSTASTTVSTVSFNFCNPAGSPCVLFYNAGTLNKIPSGSAVNGTASYSALIGANILTITALRPYIGTGTNQSRVKICPTDSTGQAVSNGICAYSLVFTITTTTLATTTAGVSSGHLLANILRALGDILGRFIK